MYEYRQPVACPIMIFPRRVWFEIIIVVLCTPRGKEGTPCSMTTSEIARSVAAASTQLQSALLFELPPALAHVNNDVGGLVALSLPLHRSIYYSGRVAAITDGKGTREKPVKNAAR